MESSFTPQDIQQLSVPDYYAGRSIFITGGTGFMGKILIEKLLRSCPDISHIYVLTRAKRGVDPQIRFQDILEGRLFAPLRNNNPNILKKVVAIRGDVTEPKLGMSSSDEELIIDTVSVILHVAATVKFDDEMNNAIRMNVIGTYSIIDLAKKIKNLSSIVHTSTAYVHCYRPWTNKDQCGEQFYPMPIGKYDSLSPEELIAVYEDAKKNGVDKTDDILGTFPNTYIFTKVWAEKVLSEIATDLPIVIMRPSIVTASWKEPFPGWVDNLNGPTGILAAAGVGLMQTMYCIRWKRADLIPVDLACNLLGVLPWKVGTRDSKALTIYNCTSGYEVPLTWGDVATALRYLMKYPLEKMLWYPYACSSSWVMSPMKNYKFLDRVCRVLFHWMPAYFIDTVCAILRIKNTSRVRLVQKMTKAMKVLEYFSTREWHWDKKNVMALYDEVSVKDRQLFRFTFHGFEGWDRYLEKTMLGTREFAMKSSSDSMDDCRHTLGMFYAVHQLWKLFLFGMFYFLLSMMWAKVFA